MFTVNWIVFILGTKASDCIANEHVRLSTTKSIAEFPSSVFLNSNLQPDYTFTVVVSKPYFLSQSASQTVTLIDEKPSYNININCELNCDYVMNPSYSLVLRANCLRCSEQSYAWGISSSSKGPVRRIAPQNTSGGLNSAVLKINPNVFKSAANDLYTINLIGKQYFVASCRCVSLSFYVHWWKLHQRLVITCCHITQTNVRWNLLHETNPNFILVLKVTSL